MPEYHGRTAAVTVMIAESSERQLQNICCYLDGRPNIRLIGAARNGEHIRTLLERGVIPDVLVLDSVLPGDTVFQLLREIDRLRLRRRPFILVSLRTDMRWIQEKLLTAGADYFILKPYRLSELLRLIELEGMDSERQLQKRVREQIRWHLEEMHADMSFTGACYLEEALQMLVPAKGSVQAQQLYERIADLESVTEDGVYTSIGRAIGRLRDGQSQAYCEMCEYLQMPPAKKIPNAEFLSRLAQIIRRELGL